MYMHINAGTSKHAYLPAHPSLFQKDGERSGQALDPIALLLLLLFFLFFLLLLLLLLFLLLFFITPSLFPLLFLLILLVVQVLPCQAIVRTQLLLHQIHQK